MIVVMGERSEEVKRMNIRPAYRIIVVSKASAIDVKKSEVIRLMIYLYYGILIVYISQNRAINCPPAL